MYDDIAYRKDNIYRRSVYVLEYAISMTTLHRERTIFRKHSLCVLDDYCKVKTIYIYRQ